MIKMKPLSNLKARVKSTTDKLSDSASDVVQEGKMRAGHVYDEAKSKLDKAEDNIKAYSKTVSKNIKKNPAPVILAVIGIGFLLASFLKKK